MKSELQDLPPKIVKAVKIQCRFTPFDKTWRFVMVKARFLFLKKPRTRSKRGANICAEAVGYGATGDAYHKDKF